MHKMQQRHLPKIKLKVHDNEKLISNNFRFGSLWFQDNNKLTISVHKMKMHVVIVEEKDLIGEKCL